MMISCLFFALFGLVMGSFLNVCIVRLPLGESVVRPRSHCRRCGHPIASWDNIPVLSWILLRAGCRSCRARISWRYPAIESSCCALFLACCLRFSPALAAGWALLCFLLLGLAVMDAETFLLPDRFTLPGLAAGLVFFCLRPGLEGNVWAWRTAIRAAGSSLLAAGVAAAFLLFISGVYWLARHRAGMGLGDVKLLAMLGAWLGLWQTGLVLFLAVIVGGCYGVGLILAGRGRENAVPSNQLQVPFGTMLSLAGLYSIFLGEPTLGWYLKFFH